MPDPEIMRHIERFKALSDEDVIALQWQPPHLEDVALRHEITRRQLVASRELTQAIRDADRSARRAAKWLIIFTIALVALSLALLVTAVVPLWSEIVKLASDAWGWAASHLP